MRAFVLRLGSTAPLGLNKCTDNNKPRACALGYAGVSPLQGSSTSSQSIYFIILMRLPYFVYKDLGKVSSSKTIYRHKKREDPQSYD